MFRDTRLVLGYELRRTLRSPAWVIFGVFQPVLWLLLFAPLLTGLLHGAALVQFTPGVLVMITLYGSLYAGFGLVAMLRTGVTERLAATPASRTALLLGLVLRDVVVAMVQAVLLLAVAWLQGLRAPLPGIAATLGLVSLVTVTGAAVSYALALSLRDENGLAQTVGFFTMPILLLSGILVPFSLAPGWLRGLGHANPFYYVVEAGRALFGGHYAVWQVPVAYGLTLVAAALAMAWATAAFRGSAA
jgi:ABC-2 type transport system permease protein